MPGQASEPSLEDWLARHGTSICLVFADIVGSVASHYSAGTEPWNLVMDAYRARARDLARALDGRILWDEGDEIFAAFPAAASGYRFARSFSEDTGSPLILVRVGVHVGVVTFREGRLTGRVVSHANRVMKHGGPREVWISDAARRALAADQPALADEILWVASEVCELKGIPEPQLLWRAASSVAPDSWSRPAS